MVDKGKDNRKAVSFVKFFTWYSQEKKQVQIIYFGVEYTRNSPSDAALGINHSLKLCEYSNDHATLTFSSILIDTCRYGVEHSLLVELVWFQRGINNCDDTSETCSFNAMNLMVDSSIERIMRSGGLKIRLSFK